MLSSASGVDRRMRGTRMGGSIFAVWTGLAVTQPSGTLHGQVTLTNAGGECGLVATHMADEVGPACVTLGQTFMTGGLAVGDFNNDTWPDVFVIGGELSPDKLFINDGTGSFTNQAAAWGVAVTHGGNGVAVGDYNKDGWQDIYVTSFGTPGMTGQPGKQRLYHNNGNGTFTDVAVAAGVNQTTTAVASGYGAAFGDYDLDGDLDLFVAAWKSNTGGGNTGQGNRLFRNNGNATFTDVTTAALGSAMAGVWGFQPAFVDMNGDLFPEILLAADFETSRYLINNGNGTFTNFTVQSGTGLDDNGMGQTVGDFDHDGDLDWYVTSIHKSSPGPEDVIGNMLYLNQLVGGGSHLYVENSNPAGVNDGGWGWGTVAVDLDHDGWLDLVEVNGRNAAEWANEPEYLFYNDGDGTFTEIGAAAGLDLASDGRSIALLDADRDGDQDFVISVYNGAMRYYRNDTASGGAWLTISFDTSANSLIAPNGFGTHVTAIANGQEYVRYFSSNPSYLATSELTLHFGLADAKIIDQLEIRWPRGNVSVLNDVAINQFLVVQAPAPADVNADGTVNVIDLLGLIGNWGPCSTPCPADVNGDGLVNVIDLLALIGQWG